MDFLKAKKIKDEIKKSLEVICKNNGVQVGGLKWKYCPKGGWMISELELVER
jgi:hypothetical protein